MAQWPSDDLRRRVLGDGELERPVVVPMGLPSCA